MPPLGIFCVPKSLVGGFGCDELVLYGIRLLAKHCLVTVLDMEVDQTEYRASNMVGRFEWFYISLTQHHKMDRETGPCEERENYSFVQCVKSSQAQEVGCRPPWDVWTSPALPLCTKTEELSQHEELDWNNFNYEQKIIINNTGCLPPCKYKVQLASSLS